jgi:hypothetical protein
VKGIVRGKESIPNMSLRNISLITTKGEELRQNDER